MKNLSAGTANKSSAPAENKTELSTEESVKQLKQRIADAERTLQEFTAAISSNNTPAGATPGEVIEKNTMMRWLVRTYKNHITLLEELESVRKREEDVNREASSWPGFNEKPPYSILIADNIRDSIQSATSKLESAKVSATLVGKLIDEARNESKGFETKIRQTSEKIESLGTSISVRLSWQLEFQKMQSRLAAARIANYEIRRKIAEEEIVEQQQKLKFLERQLSIATSSVCFPKDDLDKVISVLNTEQEHLKSEIRDAESDYPKQQKALEEAREELKLAIQNASDKKGANGGKEKIAQLQELVELRGAQAETGAKRLEVLRIISDGINMECTIWEMRFSSFGIKDFKKLQESYRKLALNSERVRLFQDYFKRQMEITSNLVMEDKNRLQGSSRDAGEIAGEVEILKEKFKAYKERDEQYQRTLNSSEKLQHLLTRWKESLDFDRKSLSFTGRMQQLITGMSSLGSRLWNFEIISVDDTIVVDGQQLIGRRSVTTGKIGEVLLTLFIGYFICCFIAYTASRVFMRRFSVDKPVAELARKWIKFFLVMLLAVFSLLAAKIPLTVFAFAGGALAIGVGFGMQNLLKNFISGIIILIERPLRVGDVVDVGGTVGVVTSIGVRSSLIRNANGIEVFIPNSTFLENDVINWTHSNREARFNVKVGVAYGCSTDKVTEILLKIAGEHGQVLKSPAPQVLLEDFGDNALIFQLNYWIDVLPGTGTRQIASDIRKMMEKKLSEAGIAISFPQRDIHIDTLKSLKIELVSGEKTDHK
ncbi:MAG: mechanosensitive ion channel domain-containing protein [Victivallales bacterium]